MVDLWLTDVTVGLEYDVPICGGWPVLGPVHEDKELNTIGPHIHYDPRFMADGDLRTLRLMVGDPRMFQADPWARVLHYALPVPIGTEFERARLRCERPMPVYRTDGVLMSDRAKAWYAVWEKIPPRCRRCPHLGYPLDAMPVGPRGRTCPMHGLAFGEDVP